MDKNEKKLIDLEYKDSIIQLVMLLEGKTDFELYYLISRYEPEASDLARNSWQNKISGDLMCVAERPERMVNYITCDILPKISEDEEVYRNKKSDSILLKEAVKDVPVLLEKSSMIDREERETYIKAGIDYFNKKKRGTRKAICGSTIVKDYILSPVTDGIYDVVSGIVPFLTAVFANPVTMVCSGLLICRGSLKVYCKNYRK